MSQKYPAPKRSPFFALFLSVSTLSCCALPALLVALGFGSVVATIASQFPAWVWLSENKGIVFGIAGGALALSGWKLWQSRNEPCPLDPDLARECTRLRRRSWIIFGVSVGIYLLGAIFAYALSA
jgi:hypothetical protein